MRREDITGLVLAGGRGSRMGGVDKGLQPWRGRPLVAWMLERLAPQVGPMMVSANRHLDSYRALGVPVCSDATDTFDGPLAGMLGGLLACRTPWLATTPCDAPRFPIDLVQRLASAVEAGQAGVAIARVTTSDGPRPQPVFALMKTDLAPALRDHLQRGGRKVRDWLQQQACVEVDFEDAAAFANFNTLDDLRVDR